MTMGPEGQRDDPQAGRRDRVGLEATASEPLDGGLCGASARGQSAELIAWCAARARAAGGAAPEVSPGAAPEVSPGGAPGAPAPEAAPGQYDPKQVAHALKVNQTQPLRIDWVCKLHDAFGLPRPELARTPAGQRLAAFEAQPALALSAAFVERIMDFQRAQSMKVSDLGVLDGETRRALEAQFPALDEPLLGAHGLSPTALERLLVPAKASPSERFTYYRTIIEHAGGIFCEERVNVLALRGVMVLGEPGSLELRQSQSAAEEHLEGTGAHFSGAERGFDDVVISLWRPRQPDGSPGPEEVRERRGSVDPASVPKGEAKGAPPYGTAHLRDGQYRFRLGSHGTARDGAHGKAAAAAWRPDGSFTPALTATRGGDRVRYPALVPMHFQELNREARSLDGPGDHNDTRLTAAEAAASHPHIVRGEPAYTHRNRKVNVHSAPDDQVTSEGCQVIPQGEDYPGFIHEIAEHSQPEGDPVANVLYTLIDASKIPVGLTEAG